MTLLSGFKKVVDEFKKDGSSVNTNFTQLSLELANRLLVDRVEFKLYAAEQVLHFLNALEKEGSISSSNVLRVRWEMNIECLIAHLVRSVDALLIRINDKLGLGLDIKYINSSSSSLSAH